MNDANSREPVVVVSMTSFPQAITYASQAIQSILKMSVLPDKLILYLTFSQFDECGIPEELKLLSKNNPIFEIRNYDRDIRSYRKLIPALLDFPEAIIVTVDDDVAYHKYDFLVNRIHRSFANLQTGVGGVLYPPHSLKPDMLDVELFTKIAPTTDDIWFWAAGAANGYPVIPVPFGRNKPRGLHKPKNLSLKTTNFKGETDNNSKALNALIERYPVLLDRLSDNR